MKCPKCQFENPAGAKFCNQCASKLELECPECRNLNPAGSKFCNECAHPLEKQKEAFAPKDLSFREKIAKIQRYLPEALTEKILSQRDRIEGERKEVTVMFCDMEGFTALTERLGPEEAYSVMDQVYEILIHKVHDYQGTVNEMTGDGIMALFGAPIALEDAPQRAIHSAMAIHREMVKFSERMGKKKAGIPTLKVRVGIHSGPVVVGTLGNDLRVEFKAVGDTVNLASRMEELARPGTTCVTEDTFRLTEGLFRFEALGEKLVKGKMEPVNVYQVIAPSTRRTRFDVSAERGLTPFVGRDRELEILLDAFERAKAGRGQAFSIVSEAGVGKSRLLYEFRKAVTNENPTFLEGRCLSYSQGIAYHPFIDLLKANFDIREEDRPLRITEKVKEGLRALKVEEGSTLPYVLQLLSVEDFDSVKVTMSPETMRERIVDSLRRIVHKGSEMRTLIVGFEDLHWVDKTSEEVLRSLIESIPGARVLLIFSYRPEFVPAWGGKSFHSQLTLNRLSNRESLSMVTYLLGTESIDRNLEELILEKTEGVPFFIEEFVRSLKDLRIIERRDDTVLMVKGIREIKIPSTIQDVIMARVDSLPEAAKEVLQTGSVIGRELSLGLLRRVTGLPEQDLLSRLSRLKDSEFVYERGIYPETSYTFKHALTQEVAYNSLLVKRRKEIHEKIGQAIERIYEERPEDFYEMLAHHYARGDNLDKAYHYLKLAGDKAARNYANWEAIRFYKEAIQVLESQPQTEEKRREKLNVCLSMYNPMVLLSYPEGTPETLQEAERLSKELEDARSLAYIYGRLGNYYAITGRRTLGIKYSEKSFDEAERIGAIDLMAPAAVDFCTAQFHAGNYLRGVQVATRVVLLLEEQHSEKDRFGRNYTAYSLLSAWLGLGLGVLGNFEEGKTVFDKGRRNALEIDDRFGMAILAGFHSFFSYFEGDGNATVNHAQEATQGFQETAGLFWTGWAYTSLGAGYYVLGEHQKARNHAEDGLKALREVGVSIVLPMSHIQLALIHEALGDLKSAKDCAEEGLRLSHQFETKGYEALAWMALGSIKGKTDRPGIDVAAEHIQQGISIVEGLKATGIHAQGHLFLGELFADAHQRDKAIENLNKAEAMYLEMRVTPKSYWLTRTREALHRLEVGPRAE
jgi:class 3 adenylate cyclase/tetratricopeptide (TPR) repeat protein